MMLRFANYLAPNMQPVYEMVAAWCGERLGLPATLTTETDFERLVRGEVDVAFLCGLPYAEMRQRHPGALELLAAPVLAGERFERRPVYYSDVVVRADSPYRAFDDLEGCRWSYNDPDSQSGFNLVRWCLAAWGRTRGFFGEVIEAGFHQRSLEWILSGQMDASAIDCQVVAGTHLPAALRAGDGLHPLRVCSHRLEPAAPTTPGSHRSSSDAACGAGAPDPELCPGFRDPP